MDRILRLLDGSAVFLLVLGGFMFMIGYMTPDNRQDAGIVAGICASYLFLRVAFAAFIG
jgi:hypothetical protein